MRNIKWDQPLKAGIFVVLLFLIFSLLKPCMETYVIQKISQVANESVYDLFFPGCAISLDDYSKTTGYDRTHVPHCIDPVCDLNNDHRPVSRKRSNLPCRLISDCVTVLVKSKHRIENVKTFVQSLHHFYPDTTVIVADELDDSFSNKDIPAEWLKLTNNSILYVQVHAGVGYGRQVAARLAATPYILVADDDFVLTPKTNLRKLVSVLSTTTVDIVGGAVNDKYLFDGLLRVMQSRTTLYQPHLVIYPGIFYEVVPCQPKCLIADVVKNFFLADRDVLLKAGGWDISRLFYEHEDFFIQMRKKRVTVAHCSDVIINHNAKDRELANLRKKQFEHWSDMLKQKWGFDDYYYCSAEDYERIDGCEHRREFL